MGWVEIVQISVGCLGWVYCAKSTVFYGNYINSTKT